MAFGFYITARSSRVSFCLFLFLGQSLFGYVGVESTIAEYQRSDWRIKYISIIFLGLLIALCNADDRFGVISWTQAYAFLGTVFATSWPQDFVWKGSLDWLRVMTFGILVCPCLPHSLWIWHSLLCENFERLCSFSFEIQKDLFQKPKKKGRVTTSPSYFLTREIKPNHCDFLSNFCFPIFAFQLLIPVSPSDLGHDGGLVSLSRVGKSLEGSAQKNVIVILKG